MSTNRPQHTLAQAESSQLAAAEEEPRLLGTVENQLGIGEWLKEQGHE